MAGKGEGEGEGNLEKLYNQISVMKYVLLFTNIIVWVSMTYVARSVGILTYFCRKKIFFGIFTCGIYYY